MPPAGCIQTAAVATTRCQYLEVYDVWSHVSSGMYIQRGISVWGGGGGVSVQGETTPVERQTPVKPLPQSPIAFVLFSHEQHDGLTIFILLF